MNKCQIRRNQSIIIKGDVIRDKQLKRDLQKIRAKMMLQRKELAAKDKIIQDQQEYIEEMSKLDHDEFIEHQVNKILIGIRES